MNFQDIRKYEQEAFDLHGGRKKTSDGKGAFESLIPLWDKILEEHGAIPSVFGAYLMRIGMGAAPDYITPTGAQFISALRLAQSREIEGAVGKDILLLEDAVEGAFSLEGRAYRVKAGEVRVEGDPRWHRLRGQSRLIFEKEEGLYRMIRNTIGHIASRNGEQIYTQIS